jgi:hypothetical protein
MLKPLHKSDTQISPFVTTADWSLSNVFNGSTILTEHSGGLPVALEYIDYAPTVATDNSTCNIALEQQPENLVSYREGKKTIGLFYPETDPVNIDGTYKRMVHSQIQNVFYNNFRDPTKIWGLEYLDFEKSQTKRFLVDKFDLYDIPTRVFGEKIIPSSVVIYNRSLDNDYTIQDDGNGNLFAGSNLFSHQQEIGDFTNEFVIGSSSICDVYFSISGSDLFNVRTELFDFDTLYFN